MVVALDRRTGNTLWTAPVESSWPPAVAGDRVVIAASDEIHALDAATGAPRWRTSIAQPAAGTMIVHGATLIVPLAGGTLVAFDVATGKTTWTARLEGVSGQLQLTPGPGGVYLSSSDGHVAAISILDGRVIWRRTIEGALTRPAAARERIIIGSSTDHFYALNPDSGKEEWRWATAADPIGAVGDADLVFLTALDNTVRAVNRGNGNQRWREVLGTRPTHPPVALGGIVVVTADSPTLSAFVGKTGAAAGTYDAPARLQGPPLIDPAPQPFSVAIVIIMRDGTVVGLTPTGLQFHEGWALPLIALPGRPLPREPAPAGSRPR